MVGVLHLQVRRRHPISFLSVDGETALPFAAPPAAAKEAEELGGTLYPFFVNEAAYYEKGMAFMLAVREEETVRVARVL